MFKFKEFIQVDKIVWHMLSANPKAIRLLEQNPSRINVCMLWENPNAIHLIKQIPDKMYWCSLSNPNAIHILEQKPARINWRKLSENPSVVVFIFFLDSFHFTNYKIKK
jgi:hypothetical protein